MKPNIYILFILIVLSFSCNIKNKDALLPSVTGKAGEVVLVMEDDYWESKIGEKWKDICAENVVGLPQMERMFDLVRIPKKAFSAGCPSGTPLLRGSCDGLLEITVSPSTITRPNRLSRL